MIGKFLKSGWNRVKGWFSSQPQQPPQPEGNEIEKYYTDTEDLINALNELARSPSSKERIFIINGVRAVGKTSVLLMVRLFCRRESIAVAYVSGSEIITPVNILREIVKDLNAAGVKFPHFDKTYKLYLAIQAKIEKEMKSESEKRATMVKDGSKIVGKGFAYAVPVAGKLVEDIGVPVSNLLVDVVAAKFSKPDYKLYLESTQRLTEVFLQDLANIDPQRRIILMLDTYEQMMALDKWVRELLQVLQDNVLVVIASQLEIGKTWGGVWPGWIIHTRVEQLGLMSDENLRKLVHRYYQIVKGTQAAGGATPDPKMVEEIVRFARGLPIVVTTVVNLWKTYGTTDFPAIKSQAIEDLYRYLLDGIPAALRIKLEEAATLRRFNREVLRFMAGAEDESAEVNATYEALKEIPFVLPGSGRYNRYIHVAVRETISASLKLNDPEQYRKLHLKAIAYYERELKRIAADGGQSSAERQELLLESTYHQFQVSENEGLEYLAQVFEGELINRRQIDFCHSLLTEVAGYNLSTDTRKWIRYYEGILASYEETDKSKTRQILEELNDDPKLDEQLKVNVLEELAGIYWFYSLRDPKGIQRAEELYQQCLELRSSNPKDTIGQARIKTWLGIFHQRVDGSGEGYFREALALLKKSGPGYENISAWLERELSISLRMQGKFEESLQRVESSIEKFENLGLKLHKAHSLVNYGMLLVFMGKLDEAEKQLNQSRKLYQASGRPQIYERAWPLIGLGDVALGRGEYEKASEHYEEALKTWEGDTFGEAVARGSIADVRLMRKEWEAAIQYADQSLAFKRDSPDKFGTGWTLNTKGRALLGKEQYTEALKCFQDGYQQMADYGSQFGKSRIGVSLCTVYLHLHQSAEFEQAAQDVETLGIINHYFHDLAQVAFLRGSSALDKYDAASGQAFTETAVQHIAQSFRAALENALQYNVYLLDSMLEKIIAALSSSPALKTAEGVAGRKAIYKNMLDGWKRGKLGETPLATVEAEKRKAANRESQRRPPLVKRLQSLLETT